MIESAAILLHTDSKNRLTVPSILISNEETAKKFNSRLRDKNFLPLISKLALTNFLSIYNAAGPKHLKSFSVMSSRLHLSCALCRAWTMEQSPDKTAGLNQERQL
jgi:hypothetical protein